MYVVDLGALAQSNLKLNDVSMSSRKCKIKCADVVAKNHKEILDYISSSHFFGKMAVFLYYKFENVAFR